MKHVVSRLALIFVISTSSSSAYAQQFNGRWEIEVDVNLPCAIVPGQRFVALISKNRLNLEINDSTKGAHLSGSISNSGHVLGEVTRGSHFAKGEGTLGADSGSGIWKSAHCEGVWTAKKIKVQ